MGSIGRGDPEPRDARDFCGLAEVAEEDASGCAVEDFACSRFGMEVEARICVVGDSDEWAALHRQDVVAAAVQGGKRNPSAKGLI